MILIFLFKAIYPVDTIRVSTVLCIGAKDQTSPTGGGSVDQIIHRQIGCASHVIITDLITDQNEIAMPASVVSCQFQCLDPSRINCVKIGKLSTLEIVEEVKIFLRDTVNNAYPVVLNLNNVHAWNDDALQATIDSVLPLCSVVIMTYDVLIRCHNNQQQSLHDAAVSLLRMGPKVIVVQDQNGYRHVFVQSNDEGLETTSYLLPSHYSASCAEHFFAAIAAFMARGTLPLNVAICYSHFHSVAENLRHSLFSSMVPLTFTQELWSSVDDIYKRTLNLPFIKKMLDSTLDERIYNYYIIQDYYFFEDRGYMLKGLVNQCENDEKIREFFKLQLEKNENYLRTILIDNNLSLHDGNEEMMERMPACVNYTALMRKLGESSERFSWIKALIALLPCTLVYAKVGDWMIESGIYPTVKRYADFIDSYRKQDKRQRLIDFIAHVDRVVNNCSYKEKQILQNIFKKVCEYEYAFWDDAYQYGNQEINRMSQYLNTL